MASFTAINASTGSPSNDPETHHDPTDDRGASQQRSKSVASEYLGRGQSEHEAAPVTEILQGLSARKTGRKSNRRARTASAAPKAKRRKSSVPDTMAVSKSTTQVSMIDQPSRYTRAKTKTKPAETVKHPDVDQVCMPTEGQIVPVYSQSTSMDSVRFTPQTTSMQAVRAASRPGQTVYKSDEIKTSTEAGVEFIQPWLNHATATASTSSITKEPLGPHPALSSMPTHAGLEAELSASRESPDVLSELDVLDDEVMADLAAAVEQDTTHRNRTPPPRLHKQNVKEVDEHDNYGGALLDEAEKKFLNGLRAASVKKNQPVPVVRQSFPPPILDRSPIFGATNGTILKTCFRIGEALNVGCQAVRMNRPVLLELYARVKGSWRVQKGKGRKQHFVFHDLYHDNPPHVNGTFELCGQSELWDLDVSAFLAKREEGIMCRVIGRMKREEMRWSLVVLNIWEAGWDDVDAVAAIYAKDPGQRFASEDD